MLNRLISAVLIALVTITGLFMYRYRELGAIEIRFAGFELQTNFLVALVAGLLLLFALSIVYHLIRSIASTFAYFGSKRKLRLSEKASQSMMHGLIEMAEGRFSRAEKLLLTEIRHNDNALVAYLGAARAAQQLNAHNRRDKYLRLAHEQNPVADTAIRLTKAELQLSHKQYEQALATLTMLLEESPRHAYVLQLLATVHADRPHWQNLKRIMPEVKKQQALSAEDTAQLENRMWNGLMDEVAISRNVKALMEFWNDMPKTIKLDAAIVAHYARCLKRIDAAGEAEHVLRQYLGNNWDEDIVRLYAEIDVVADSKQLETAESWLHQHQQNAWLLLALGNMCTNQSLWGKARNYYEASIAVRPLAENYLRLARLLEENMDDAAAAQEYYRQGLHLLAGQFGESTERLLNKPNTLGKPTEERPALKIV